MKINPGKDLDLTLNFHYREEVGDWETLEYQVIGPGHYQPEVRFLNN